MWHLGQVDDGRLAADVLAESHRQRRTHVAVLLAGNDLQQTYHLPLGVRQFERHRRLAGHRFDDTHGDQRQRAGEILGEVEDLYALDTDGGLDFIAGDDGAGVGGGHRHLDTEVGKLALDQTRSVLERLGPDAVAVQRRGFEEMQRWQHAAGYGFRKQRHLPLTFHTLLDFRW